MSDDKKIILNDDGFLTDIYNKFSPDTPLLANDPVYVICSNVRGNDDIFKELGKKIIRSNKSICKLYTGHRGGGKSTELLLLQDKLEKEGCRVIYFEVDKDIDLNDVDYADILLSCTKNIVEGLKDEVEKTHFNDLYTWMTERLNKIVDLGLSEVRLENLSIEQQISPLNKITTTTKVIPDKRRQIREQINDDQIRFTEILNEFIDQAKKNLTKKQQSKLVVIADNLDRIVMIRHEDNSSNYERIFIDRASSLKSLHCHVIYTVPISLVYSNRASNLRENYGDTEVLPMIMVRDKQRNPYPPGIAKVKELINKRIEIVADDFIKKQNLTPNIKDKIEITANDLFDEETTLDLLCEITGGHLREIMFLMQESINEIDTFPITKTALNMAIAKSRNTYEVDVDHEDWEKLVDVYNRKRIINQDDYRELLFRRCVLEYREPDTLQIWHAVHPLIEEIDEFKNAVIREKSNTGNLSGD